MAKTLEYYRNQIDREVDYVDIKPYSHNIISLALSIIADKYRKKQANKAIEDFDLENLGWKKV